MIREKRHRLPYEVYKGVTVVSITACTKYRVPFFTTHGRFEVFEAMLMKSLIQFECGADVYLFMPDHVHLLLRGKAESSDVLSAMRSFKQQSGFWLSQNHASIRWQKDFFDHIVRSDESLDRHIQYILNNPVRAGLVEYRKDYPFKGSTIHNLVEWD